MDSKKDSSSKNILLQQGGQIVLEYILLLVVGVGVATLITTQMVSRNPNSPGFLVQKWSSIITEIGADFADDVVEEK